METIATFTAKRAYTPTALGAADDLPEHVTIDVWESSDGFIPESVDLGMGHCYRSIETAAADLARRHGYQIEERIA